MDDTPAQNPTPASPPPVAWTLPEPVVSGPAPGYVYAGFWRRFAAFIIDGFILVIPAYIVLIAVFLGSVDSSTFQALGDPNNFVRDPATGRLVPDPATMAAFEASFVPMMSGFILIGLLFLVLQFLYYAGFWAWKGGTPGQLILGMQVRNERDGTRISFGRASLRYLGYLVSGWVLYIGFIWVAFDARKQGWHDKIANTVVIRRVG